MIIEFMEGMMSKESLGCRLPWMLVGFIVLASAGGLANGDDRLGGFVRGLKRTLHGAHEVVAEREQPQGCTHPSVEELAGQIDWLEHHLELYGSAVPKQPNIWGEARLIRHRQEVEQELAAKIGAFEQTIQAALSRADAASTAINVDINNPATSATASATATATTNSALALEPSIVNDQLFRYMNALNSLRRINEGDDTADAPGYAMNLVRVPVSVLPGKRTRQGYGAEVSLTIHPQLSNDLLPKTFRSLVINDQVDQLALPIVRLLEGTRTVAGTQEKNLRGIDRLKALARAERAAEPLWEALQARLAYLESTYPQSDFLLYMRKIQEYLRRRIVHVQALADFPEVFGQDDRPARLYHRKIVYGNQEIEVSVSLGLSQFSRLMKPLFTKGYAVSKFDVTLKSPGQAERTFPVRIAIVEVEDFKQLRAADLPYRALVPLGPIDIENLFNQRIWLEESDVCKLQKAGMDNLELVAQFINSGEVGRIPDAPSDFQLRQGLQQLLKEIAAAPGFGVLPIDEGKLELLFTLLMQECGGVAEEGMMLKAAPNNGECDLLSLVGPQTKELICAAVRNELRKGVQDAAEFWKNAADNWNVPVQQLFRSIEQNESEYSGAMRVQEVVQTWNQSELNADDSPIFARYEGGISDEADRLSLNGSSILPDMSFGSPSPLRSRRASHPIAPSMLQLVYGTDNLRSIAQSLDDTLEYSPANQGAGRLLIDVDTILTDELQAAYDLLSQQQLLHCWQFGCVELANAIQGHDWTIVRQYREEYESRLPPGVAGSVAGALGWGLMVESSLLNELLIADIQAQAAKSGLNCGDVSGYCFWGPAPPEESRQVFNDYVVSRWPIQVFALDPITQDQTVTDAYSIARDLQLSVAAAASSGQIPVGLAGSFARDLELKLQAIALNRTAVGFSHGENTFGWRFYPRVQTPGTPGTLGAIGQTLLGGPTRDSLTRQSRLEPGIRECIAMVIMPSFIENISISSRSSWFHLLNPSDKELTVTDAMRLSSAQQGIVNFLNCAHDCNCYRPGDVAQLTNVVAQLEHRLPLQSASVQVPYENTLGGYELLQSGVSGLAPDLSGWYGAPGIDPVNPTQLFLVGQGFSVHHTRVIAGGRQVNYRLISREIMEVTIPPGVQPLGYGSEPGRSCVDIHVANPYGISSHLLVPMVVPQVPTIAPTWNPGALQVSAILTAPPTNNTAAGYSVRIGVNPPVPLGIEVPLSTLGNTGNIELNLFVSTEAGLAQVGTAAVSLNARFDSTSRRYVVPAEGLNDLLMPIQTFLKAEADAKRLTPGHVSLSIAARGALKAPSTGSVLEHSVSGLLPIHLNLNWR